MSDRGPIEIDKAALRAFLAWFEAFEQQELASKIRLLALGADSGGDDGDGPSQCPVCDQSLLPLVLPPPAPEPAPPPPRHPVYAVDFAASATAHMTQRRAASVTSIVLSILELHDMGRMLDFDDEHGTHRTEAAADREPH